MEFRRHAREQLQALAVGAGDEADGDVGVLRVDVTLEAVRRLVEVVVGVVDPVAELGVGRAHEALLSTDFDFTMSNTVDDRGARGEGAVTAGAGQFRGAAPERDENRVRPVIR